MIIAHLICDTRSLWTCSMTCYSWYIAAAPHLYCDILINANSWDRTLRLPDCSPMLGLFPLAKTLWVRGGDGPNAFSAKRFGRSILRHFSTFNNIQRLLIDDLDIPSFMPRIRRYFGHFSPTVRLLSLREPKGSRRQIIYFIGLFQYLEGLELFYDRADPQEEPVDDLTLIPPFVPPLGEWLVLACFTRVGLLEDMIYLFRRIRFRGMDLFDVDGMRLLLDACAEALGILRLYPIDPRGGELSLNSMQVSANYFTVGSFLRDFDLSRNKSLHTLQVTASSIERSLSGDLSGTASSLLDHALSTIMSPTFRWVTVFYRRYDFRGVESQRDSVWPHLREMSQAEIAEEPS